MLSRPVHCPPGAGRPVRETAEGQLTLGERAAREVERLIERYTPSRFAEETKSELSRLMEREARRHELGTLPAW